MSRRELRIYMNDQLALGVAWRELASRARRQNEGSELGDVLARVADDIADDVATFEGLMGRLGLRRNRLKTVAAATAERLGRLKLNGRLRSYSPLSRFVELDALAAGIEGKRTMWSNLRDLAGLDEQGTGLDFEQLIERAAAQRAEIEPHRCAAGREAFGPGTAAG